MDKADAVKPNKSIGRSQPKITVSSLRDRTDERGRDAIFGGPDCMRVFGKGLVRIRCFGLQRKQDAARSRAEGTYQTTCQQESHGDTALR